MLFVGLFSFLMLHFLIFPFSLNLHKCPFLCKIYQEVSFSYIYMWKMTSSWIICASFLLIAFPAARKYQKSNLNTTLCFTVSQWTCHTYTTSNTAAAQRNNRVISDSSNKRVKFSNSFTHHITSKILTIQNSFRLLLKGVSFPHLK